MTKIQYLETDIFIHRSNIQRINNEIEKLQNEKVERLQKISRTYDKIEEIEFRKEDVQNFRYMLSFSHQYNLFYDCE